MATTLDRIERNVRACWRPPAEVLATRDRLLRLALDAQALSDGILREVLAVLADGTAVNES